MTSIRCRVFVNAAVFMAAGLLFVGHLFAQEQLPPPFPERKPSPPPVVQKLGPNRFTIGAIQVDTAKREVSVTGRVNDVMVLEWLANARDGVKAYESFMTADTDAVAFNAALILIGLDKSRSRVPRRHFDPIPPAGDPVEISVEWTVGGVRKVVSMDQVLFDKIKGQVPSPRPWVYTGSTMTEDNKYWADLDGVLIGFVHSPAPIIEQVNGAGVDRFGAIVPNPNLGLAPNTPVRLIIRNATPAPQR